LSVQVAQRSKGRNVVAMAAYRAGQALHDGRSGTTFDFARKRGVEHTEIMTPEGSAAWLKDRDQLWSRVEAMETRKDAQLAREINLALPHELDADARRDLVRAFVAEAFVSRGMVADIAIHAPVAARGDDPRNHHAHVMLTMRQATAEGLRAVKTREWNSDSLVQEWRALWADHQNRALERGGVRERVDHRSLKAQRAEAQARGDRQAAAQLDRQPELHEGPRARKVAKRGGQGEAPQSRERRQATARSRDGRWTSGKSQAKRERVIDYRRIDRGSRSDECRRRVAAREVRTARRSERAEVQQVRTQQRLLRLERNLRTGGTAHQRQRANLLRQLSRELTRLLTGLTARRTADRRRLAELVRAQDIARALGQGRGQDRSRQRGRGRTRRR
jgi:hypothetical protein